MKIYNWNKDDERVTILFGPPGTGKTHTLINVVSEALEKGIEPEKIAFLSFTRQAAEEAVSRAVEKFKLDRNRFPYFRTLHSLSYGLLGLKRSNVMSTEHFKDLSEHLGLGFKSAVDENTHRFIGHKELGDQFLSIYSMARAKGISISEEYNSENYYPFDLSAAEDFVSMLNSYKKYYGIFDFADFLDVCQKSIDVDLMIIDEAQDLTPQEWNFAKRIGRNCKRILIAGDDDQAIFTWAGADINRFLGLKGRKIVLPKSYRLPKPSFELCNNISSRISHRFPKDWTYGRENGVVESFSSSMKSEINLGDINDDWLIQCRHQSQVTQLEKLIRQQGRPYISNGVDITQTPVFRAVINYEKLRSGKCISPLEAKNIFKFIKDFEFETFSQKDLYEYKDIKWPFKGKLDWMSALDLIGTEDFEFIRSCLRRGNKLSKTPNIKLTTIHGAKGLEANNVLLMTWANNRVRQAANYDLDSELRVWYVGASRTKNKLVTIGPDYFLNNF